MDSDNKSAIIEAARRSGKNLTLLQNIDFSDSTSLTFVHSVDELSAISKVLGHEPPNILVNKEITPNRIIQVKKEFLDKYEVRR